MNNDTNEAHKPSDFRNVPLSDVGKLIITKWPPFMILPEALWRNDILVTCNLEIGLAERRFLEGEALKEDIYSKCV